MSTDTIQKHASHELMGPSQLEPTLTCPECGDSVLTKETWTEQYGSLTVRGCPLCECTSEVVKWLHTSH